MLLVGAVLLAASVFLFSLIFGLFGAAGAFATGSILLAITVIWDVTVERPNRQDRLGEAYAASVRSGKGIPAGTPVDTTYWTDALAEPFRALGRKAPATLAGLLVIGVALGINGLLGGFTTNDRDDGVYVLMTSGAMAEVKGEGGANRSLRVTLLVTLDRPERANSQLSPARWRKYWAAEVTVENTGAEDISAPAWKLHACGEEHDPVSTRALGENLADGFTLSPGEARTGWVVFEIHLFSEPGWVRARLPGYPSIYFTAEANCRARR